MFMTTTVVMLCFHDRAVRHCDGVSRRGWLTAGAMGVSGLTLADVLRAEDAAGIGSSRKAVINVHLDGGPPQLETIDPKPLAPAEIRVDFGGAGYKWFKNILGDLSYDELDEIVEKSRDNLTKPLVFLPYMVGQRAPIWNDHTRGVMFGLEPSMGRSELAKTFMEGNAMGVKRIIDLFESLESNRLLVVAISADSFIETRHLSRKVLLLLLRTHLSNSLREYFLACHHLTLRRLVVVVSV